VYGLDTSSQCTYRRPSSQCHTDDRLIIIDRHRLLVCHFIERSIDDSTVYLHIDQRVEAKQLMQLGAVQFDHFTRSQLLQAALSPQV